MTGGDTRIPAAGSIDLSLLSDYQRGFPMVSRPFEYIGAGMGLDGAEVIERYRTFAVRGQLSRIGAVWGTGAGGAAALCAMAVPANRLDQVAELVNRHAGVNHNYEREHEWNLWFVVTGPDDAAVRASVACIRIEAGLQVLFLPMVRAYRIDLGFDLRTRHAAGCHDTLPRAMPVMRADEALAALAEEGLPLVAHPYDAWAEGLELPREAILATLKRWVAQGTLRRFGVVVRHHDLGFGCNAMTVIDAPEDATDTLGRALACQPGVTLAYRRQRDRDWAYNLYFMVHGRERQAVHALVRHALAAAGASTMPHQVLFSRRRFKQTGGRYFRRAPVISARIGEHT